MAHHKSAKKRIIVSAKKSSINKSSISKLKTLVKNVYEAKDKDAAKTAYTDAVSYLDKMTSKGRIHTNNAARKKSQLTVHINKISSN